MRIIFKIINVVCALLTFAGVSLAGGKQEMWSRSYPLEGANSEIGGDIKVDSIKNSLYITGLKCVKEGVNIRGLVAVRKIDLEGKELWKQVCDIGVYGLDQTGCIAVDNKNNVYIAGFRYIEGKGKNLWSRKYDLKGNIIWDNTYENLYDSKDAEFKELACDAKGNIYAVGYKNTEELKRDQWLRKDDPDGQELWKVIFSGSGSKLEKEQGLAVDPEGNAFVAIYENGENSEYLLKINKYDVNGSILISKQYRDSREKNRSVNKIAVDNAGNIYITGTESVFYQGNNVFVRKFDAKGLELWTKSYPNFGYQQYTGSNIIIDNGMNVYVSATSGGGKDEKKYSWISKLDKDGNELWTTDYSGYSYGVKFAVREDGAFYVLGTETDKNNNSNLWVRKYIQYSEK